MRLLPDTKDVVLGNVELIKYCQSKSIDLNKLSKCSIEHMWPHFVFGLRKENVPISKCELPLDIDIASQPDIVLIMTVNNGKLSFETTEKTIRILNK